MGAQRQLRASAHHHGGGAGIGPDRVKEEASIDYEMSPYGALLPVKTEHRETRGGSSTENQFRYSNFKQFGASSDIKFESDK